MSDEPTEELMAGPTLQLRKLQVTTGGRIAYSERFHSGVNIIRGENGSGKSTIADFIFYILGGEFDDWKAVARNCDEVQAEILTSRGPICLRRDIEGKQAPIKVFFGSWDEAQGHSLDGWETFAIRRHEKSTKPSFSQMMFRSMLIPEAQSDGASNITMHQILRLLYADQRSPSTRLFRFETWDTQNIRSAVGDLICGVAGYELYETSLAIREKESLFEEVRKHLSALLKLLPSDESLNNPAAIRGQIQSLEQEREGVLASISKVDEHIDEGEVTKFLTARRTARDALRKTKEKVAAEEAAIAGYELEIADLDEFLKFLGEMIEKVEQAEASRDAIGHIEFSHCPACLAPLKSQTDEHQCHACGSEKDPENEKARYNQIRLDFEIQQRESRQLLDQKLAGLAASKSAARTLGGDYRTALGNFSAKFDLSSSPREAFLADQNRRAGEIGREILYLTKSLETAEQIEQLSSEKAKLQEDLSKLRDRRSALDAAAKKRRNIALGKVSDIAASLLRKDLDRQPEFADAQSVSLSFPDDAILVDGRINFAESSNVFLKNSAILALFLAAGLDRQFYHPHFLLLDNIEDKGMEEVRSHHFQRLLVETATELKIPYQVIFTTSMMNPDLELEDYVIGPHYNHENRTLQLN